MSAETVAEPRIDKTNWAPGPWIDEPDRVQWQHAGYACMLLRHPHGGHWCGYVGVDRAHPFYGRKPLEEELPLEGPWDLNYGDRCDGAVCHIPEPGMPEDVWWLGFDCGHAFDLCPGAVSREILAGLAESIESERIRFHQSYVDIHEVRHRVELLAAQLRARA